MPVDASITSALRAGGLQRSSLLRQGAWTFNVLGDPGAVVAAAGAYVIGRVTRSARIADLGFHAGEALVVSGVATELIKGISGRQRPYVDERDAADFRVGRGFRVGARTSFPSGHTTAAFAVAAAVVEETRHSWPGAPTIVGPLLYGGASLVGLARIYDARHWASDVLVGGAIGTIAGRRVVRRRHASATRRTPSAERRIRAAIFLTPARGPTAGVSIHF
jgi:membrane-associated phospholipid phosphatase